MMRKSRPELEGTGADEPVRMGSKQKQMGPSGCVTAGHRCRCERVAIDRQRQ